MYSDLKSFSIIYVEVGCAFIQDEDNAMFIRDIHVELAIFNHSKSNSSND